MRQNIKKLLIKAKQFALEDKLITFGIKPTFAETGFGYIESIDTYDVKAFHEKPDFDTATSYLKVEIFIGIVEYFMFKGFGVF